MSQTLLNIRKKVLGDRLFEKCIKGQSLSDQELQIVANRFNDDGKQIITTDDIINICKFKTKNQINLSKDKILGNTNNYCHEGSINLPKHELTRIKQNKLQKILTDEEFLHLCKTTGWYEETIHLIMNLILFNVNGKLIPGQSERIVNNLREKLVTLQLEAEKKEEEKKPKYKNITLLKNNHIFYSSLPYDILKEDFELLRIIWCSPEISQSILFMLGNEKNLIHPCFFSFKTNKPLFLLNSTNMDNDEIFDDILDAESIRKIKKVYSMEFGNNANVLCVIEAINRIAKIEENNPSLKLHGYRNRYDQNELALIDFHKLVDKNSIKKGIFEKIILKNVRYTYDKEFDEDSFFIYNFPFLNKSLFNTQEFKKIFQTNKQRLVDFSENDFHIFKSYTIRDELYNNKEVDVYRAACPDAKYDLVYYYEDDKNTKYTFSCSQQDLENDDAIIYDLFTI
jgi:hypothetical protein